MKNEKQKLEGVSISLSPQKSEELFYNSLCNGLQELGHYGLELDYTVKDYEKARKTLQAKLDAGNYPKEMYIFKDEKPKACFEDVLMEILRNGDKLKVIDHEGEGSYDSTIVLSDVHARVQKTQINHLNDAIEQNDDAVTADVILQTVFFEDIIFG